MTKAPKIPEQHIQKCVLQLRFGTNLNVLPKYVLLSYVNISKALNVAHGRVIKLCKQHEKDVADRQKNFLQYFARKSQILKKEHNRLIYFSEAEKNWVCDQNQLISQVALNLKERAAAFNRKFDTDKATPYLIRKIYRRKGVKQNNIKITKVLTPEQKVRQQAQVEQLKIDIQAMELDGYKIVQVDEMMCTVGTLPKKCWSMKYKPMNIDRKDFNKDTIAVCAGISQDGGVEHISYFKRSLDQYAFSKFLTELKKEIGDHKVCIYMDQLRVHTAHSVKKTIADFGWTSLLNACYYPDGNGIEYIFGKVKHHFKKLRIHAILNGKRDRAKLQLVKSFATVSIDDCRNAIQRSFKNINKFQ